MLRLKYSLVILSAIFALAGIGFIVHAMVTSQINLLHLLILLIFVLLSSFCLNFHLKTLKLYHPTLKNYGPITEGLLGSGTTIGHHLWISPIVFGLACIYLAISHASIFMKALFNLGFTGNALLSLCLFFVFMYFGVCTFIDLRKTNALIPLMTK